MKSASSAASIKYSGQWRVVIAVRIHRLNAVPPRRYSRRIWNKGARRQDLADEMTRLLITTNLGLLRQAESLLQQLDDRTYGASSPAIAPHRAGGHMRHILEFYECLLDGATAGSVDYDARKRDVAVETERGAALARVRTTMRRLEALDGVDVGRELSVRMEAHDAFLRSSLARELQVLSSHTVHHFALIALVLRALGAPVDPQFGMAPSTLRHHAEAATCAR
jgi:hypothetical protein